MSRFRFALLFSASCVIAIVVSSDFVVAEQSQPAQPIRERDWHAYIAEGRTTYDMRRRGTEAHQALRAEMDEILELMYAEYDDERDKLLKKNQQAWVIYCESRCELSHDEYRGGSLAPINSSHARVDLLSARILELAAIHESFNTP